MSCTCRGAQENLGVEKEDEFFRFLVDNKVKFDLDKYDFDTAVELYRLNLPILKKYWEERTIKICNRICGSNRAIKLLSIKMDNSFIKDISDSLTTNVHCSSLTIYPNKEVPLDLFLDEIKKS